MYEKLDSNQGVGTFIDKTNIQAEINPLSVCIQPSLES